MLSKSRDIGMDSRRMTVEDTDLDLMGKRWPSFSDISQNIQA
jgi:hypothetical protein